MRKKTGSRRKPNSPMSQGGQNTVLIGYGGANAIPQSVTLSTGHKSGLIINPRERFNKTNWSSLFVMNGSLFPYSAIDKDTEFNRVLKNDLYPYINRTIQNNLNYEYTLSESTFMKYIYKLSAALQIYYTLNKIITYNNNINNRNDGMDHLRSIINADVRRGYDTLGKYLGSLPIPPNLLTLVRFCYQNFKLNNVENVPEFMLGFGQMLNPTCSPLNDQVGTDNSVLHKYKLSSVLLQRAINDLKYMSNDINKIYQAIPEWRVSGAILPGTSDTAVISDGFKTFWFNSSNTWADVATDAVTYTVSGSASANFDYYINQNWEDLDALWYAMSSFYLTTDTAGQSTRPGLWSPVDDYSAFTTDAKTARCSLLRYEEITDSSPVMRPLNLNGTSDLHGASQAGLYRIPYLNTTSNAFYTHRSHSPAVSKVQEATFNTFKQAVARVSEWILL